jgi:ribonuclease HII
MRLALKKAHKSGLCKNRKEVVLSDYLVLMDGGLKAPTEYVHQKTIIKGDDKEKVIGLASIMAKVTRDLYMIRQAKFIPYNLYDFDIHKGYGTKAHRELIKKYGLSKEHRVSFCKNLQK